VKRIEASEDSSVDELNETSPIESSEREIGEVQKELLLIKLRRTDIHKRIQAIWHAVTSLVEVFGPEILEGQGQRFQVPPHNVSYRCPRTMDLCREILKDSAQWLTTSQILELMRKKAPLLMARFQNPGVSLSNALRTLQRRAEVEGLDIGSVIKWRWVKSYALRVNPEPIREQQTLIVAARPNECPQVSRVLGDNNGRTVL